ncbi:MAG: hypothetical protein IKW58_03185 [Alphaproteobacteria bacterium]|nr:hypothetical protein [Alphaproteobacteria bacterium]
MRKLLFIIPWWNDCICERVDSLLKEQDISPRIEAIIFYIYKEKRLPFVPSNLEETEVFDVLERCIGPKETIKVLNNYFHKCGFPSNHSAFLLNKLVNSYNISVETLETFNALKDAKDSTVDECTLDYIDRKEQELVCNIKYYLKCQKNKYGKRALCEIEKDVWLDIRCLWDVVDSSKNEVEFFKIKKLFNVLKKAVSNGENNIHHVIMDFIEPKR